MRPPQRSSILRLLSACCVLVSLAACAKIGDPRPPTVQVPGPSTDLRAIQYSNIVVLTVSMPQKNTDGSPVSTLETIEIFRVREGLRGIARSWSDDEFEQKAERILAVNAAGFGPYVSGTAFVYRDEKPVADPARLYRSGLTYSVRFINRRYQTAGFGNRAYIEPIAMPAAPVGIAFALEPDRVRLTWQAPPVNSDGSKPPRLSGYNVYRSNDPRVFPPAPLNGRPLAQSSFEDPTIEFGKTYYYAVSVVGSTQDPYAESAPSTALRVDAVDTFAPGPPGNLNAVLDAGVAVLLWTAPQESDVAGYRVYRAVEGAARNLLSPSPIQSLSFRDESPPAGKRVTYSVSAVDRSGNEGSAAEVSVDVR